MTIWDELACTTQGTVVSKQKASEHYKHDAVVKSDNTKTNLSEHCKWKLVTVTTITMVDIKPSP